MRCVIAYETDVSGVRTEDLVGFFVGWPIAPSPDRHLALLRGSDYVIVARDSESGRIVGFVSAHSDGVLSAYIPLLEVLPAYQSRGVGTELVRRLFELLEGHYMIDLACDEDLVPFYERFGMVRGVGMLLRDRNTLAE